MLSEKEMKQKVKEEASASPDRFFPTEKMLEIGLIRQKCENCSTYYWSADPERKVCGEPVCEGGYSFIGEKNCRYRMDFIDVWKRFSDLFKRRGYTPIQRYPSISRWNPTSEFTLASITDFQPYVVRGSVRPPANPLVVPQTCLRFNDVDNVGITGRHNTGFIMIGQHAFVPEEEFDQSGYFDDIHAWLVEGMGIPLKDIVYHEDAWAGGGNFGCSLEFFSKGLEIGNQVYTMYERDGNDLKGLDIRVLDMGMGQERPAWFSYGTPTAYEPNFPTVMDRLFSIAGIDQTGEERDIMSRFLPYSGLLNMDETDDIDRTWSRISKRIGVDVGMLKDSVMTHAGLYSVADHSRALLFALCDGGLPSNSGGGYNLRLIYRRAMEFIEKYGWDLDLGDVCNWHAKYLEPQFPEMLESIEEVREILDHERGKFFSTKKKARATVERLVKKQEKGKKIRTDDLLRLYDSQGITPDLLISGGLDIDVPSDFYRKVSRMHEENATRAKTQKEFRIDLVDLPETVILYFNDYLLTEFRGTVLAVVDNNIVLDRTAFYPTSGGQMHDIGCLKGQDRFEVMDVFKQDNLIVHQVKGDTSLIEPNQVLEGHIDAHRRKQLAQHHTTTHIINGVCRMVLGDHIWQAGAEKTEQKGRLDITHYETLNNEQLEKIERYANEVVENSLEVRSMILSRDEAEKRYGFRLYQGGAVPGETLRVVSIEGLDTEACGGTHLNNTSEARRITITGTKKIQDGIVRIEYVAGARAKEMYEKDIHDLVSVMGMMDVTEPDLITERSRDIFESWKKIRKFNSRSMKMDRENRIESVQRLKEFLDEKNIFSLIDHWEQFGIGDEGKGHDIDVARPHDRLHSSAVVFKVQKKQLTRTVRRFIDEISEWIDDIDFMEKAES